MECRCSEGSRGVVRCRRVVRCRGVVRSSEV